MSNNPSVLGLWKEKEANNQLSGFNILEKNLKSKQPILFFSEAIPLWSERHPLQGIIQIEIIIFLLTGTS